MSRSHPTAARILRLLACLVFVATLATWIVTGAHIGWTRTSVTKMQHDEVTGIDFPVERAAFVAGFEVLAGGVSVAVALGLAGLLLGRRSRAAAGEFPAT